MGAYYSALMTIVVNLLYLPKFMAEPASKTWIC